MVKYSQSIYEKEIIIVKNIILLPQEKQDRVLHYMPDKSTLTSLSGFFSAFSDNTRLKIITALSLNPMCVNDISVLLNLNQTTVSHQLKLLKQLNVVQNHRYGKIILYSLSSKTVQDVMTSGVNHLIG